MFRFCSLVSGSSGNCLFIENDDTKLLVDCGVSCKRTKELLKSIGVNIEDIDAVLVTHEHSDHINGLNIICKYYGIPVYTNKKTAEAIKEKCPCVNNINVVDGSFSVKSIDIFSFSTPHDVPSCCYSFTYEGKKITMGTDMGHLTPEIISAFEGSRFAYIESNHDVDMLTSGPYPYPLKRRILSDYGHLSNKVCSELIVRLAQKGTCKFMLGHLSEDNNTPETALNSAKNALKFFNTEAEVSVAPRNFPGSFINL